MPSFNDVLTEIQNFEHNNAQDRVREQYVQKLHAYTGRNVICYYSGWLSAQGPGVNFLQVDDMDKNGFMNAIEGMNCDLGLDLILHTPGGSITAAESIVYYLRQKFGRDIRVIVPQMAMSAGTMIALSAKEIVMGHHSCIGPFDPFVQGVSAFAVFEEFKRASNDILNSPHTLPLWQIMLQKYPPAFLEECDKAIALAKSIVPEWLTSVMFSDLNEDEQKTRITNIMENLNNPATTKEHSRHIHFDKAQSLGLKVTALEADHQFQDLVLTVHHTYIATFLMTNAAKLIESHHGKKHILTRGQ